MNAKQLQMIKARAENATYGPWKVVKSEESGTQIGTAWEHPQLKACSPIVTLGYGVDKTIIYINQDNANFIAHARQDIPKLVAEVERLQAENEKFTNSILHDTYSEFVHTAEIDKLKLENEKLKHLMEQMVSKKMYKIIIDFAEGRLKELPIELEDKE